MGPKDKERLEALAATSGAKLAGVSAVEAAIETARLKRAEAERLDGYEPVTREQIGRNRVDHENWAYCPRCHCNENMLREPNPVVEPCETPRCACHREASYVDVVYGDDLILSVQNPDATETCALCGQGGLNLGEPPRDFGGYVAHVGCRDDLLYADEKDDPYGESFDIYPEDKR